jgi:hypothetical protein
MTTRMLLADGEPVHVVSEWLGHRDVSVTLNVYAHVLKNHQRAAAERMGPSCMARLATVGYDRRADYPPICCWFG